MGSSEENVFHQLIRDSQIIVVGKMLSFGEATMMEAGVLERVVNIRILEVIKGDLRVGENITFSTLTGTFLKNSKDQSIEQRTKLQLEKKYVFFSNVIRQYTGQGETVELTDQWLGIHKFDPYLVHDIRKYLK